MDAIKEIGLKKTLRFFFFSIVMIFFKLMIFPPMKTFFLRIFGAKIGKDTIINNVKFINLYRTGIKGLSIGNNCFIGDECILDLANEIIIGDHTTLAVGATILTHINVGYKNHPLQKRFPSFSKKTIIESGCFIGANSIILGGKRIGKCSFIAVGSVITKDVPPNSLAMGVPAKTKKL